MEGREISEKKALKNKRLKRFAIAIGAIMLATLLFLAGWFAMWFSLGKNARGFLWAVKTAKRHFYKDITEEEIYEEVFDSLTDALDPYSQYFAKEEHEAELDRTAGKSAGYGFSLYDEGSVPVVYSLSGNSPAELAGVRNGMYVTGFGAAGGELSSGTRQDVSDFLDKADGPVVFRCGYERDGSDAQDYTFEYGAYRVSYCLYRDMGGAYRFDPNDLGSMIDLHDPLEGADADTAYIRFDRFYGTAAEEFEACLALMKERGRKDLIIDLRGNGGGYLNVFSEISAHLLKNAQGNRPIVATARYRNGSELVYRAPANDYDKYFTEDSEVYIIANENTASASECLIGALVTYGTLGPDPYSHIYLRANGGAAKTYGKGIMQSTYTDSAGNALKLTVAQIFWPDGTSIHGKGVTEEDGAKTLAGRTIFAGEDTILRAMLLDIAGA